MFEQLSQGQTTINTVTVRPMICLDQPMLPHVGVHKAAAMQSSNARHIQFKEQDMYASCLNTNQKSVLMSFWRQLVRRDEVDVSEVASEYVSEHPSVLRKFGLVAQQAFDVAEKARGAGQDGRPITPADLVLRACRITQQALMDSPTIKVMAYLDSFGIPSSPLFFLDVSTPKAEDCEQVSPDDWELHECVPLGELKRVFPTAESRRALLDGLIMFAQQDPQFEHKDSETIRNVIRDLSRNEVN